MLQRIYRLKEALRNLNPAFRRTIKVVLDTCVVLFSLYLAYLARFEWTLTREYQTQWPVVAPFFVAVSLAAFWWSNAYTGFWVWWSIRDLKSLVVAHTAAVAALLAADVFVPSVHVPRSIFLIYWFFAIGFLGLLRLFCRTVLEIPEDTGGQRKKRLLIVGAGRAAEMLVWQVISDPKIPYDVAGLIDDDPRKLNRSIHGVRVLGGRAAITGAVRARGVDEILIALPSASSREMRRVVAECEKAGVPFSTVPGPRELVDGKVTLNRVRKVNIEDLLGRAPHRINLKRIEGMVRGASVLVTGAAGSIGSEMCRQILALKPRRLLGVDINENGLFYLEHELKSPDVFVPVVASVSNRLKMRRLFEAHRPSLVFHAAAYKHVPSMEANPTEAIRNNVEATICLAGVARDFRIGKFVQISTDKAVAPTNIMGVSKRLCELYCQYLSRHGHDAFLSVRFGNVIGSQGSVVTVFEEQIRRGEPITVTHPDMKRYFMSIPEACRLVLEAAAIGRGGYIYILDMGSPIRIVDLARQMIRLAGLVPDRDIPRRVTGVRPGEKLNERLWYPYEIPEKTENSKIQCTNGVYPFPDDFLRRMEMVLRHSRRLETGEMVRTIKTLVPEYSGNGFLKDKTRRAGRPRSRNGGAAVRSGKAPQSKLAEER